MATETKYSRKQLTAMMKQYTADQLEPCSFTELPVKFAYDFSQFGDTVSCHLRTTQGIVLQVSDLTAWFEKLPAKRQEEILGE